MKELTKATLIEDRIFTIRNQKVMIDRDLAELYGVQTKRLNEAVKRNINFTQHDKAISQIINVLNHLIDTPRETKQIGFKVD